MAQLLRGCAHSGPFAAPAAPDDDEALPIAEYLNRWTRALLQVRNGKCAATSASLRSCHEQGLSATHCCMVSATY